MRTRSTSGRRCLSTLAGAAAAVALFGTAPAVAASGDSLWYYNATGVAEAHQRTTGAGVQIAVIDSRVNPGIADLSGTTLSVHEPSYCAEQEGGPAAPATDTSEAARHTTSIAAMLVGNGAGIDGSPGAIGVAPGASVTVYASRLAENVCPEPADGRVGGIAAFQDAVADGADIVVVPGTTNILTEDYAPAVRAGVVVVAAGGNEGGPVTGVPATYNGAVTTGTTQPDGSLDPGSPRGDELGVVAPGQYIHSIDPTFSYYGVTHGSSNSAAFTAGALALAMSAYPDATSDQILQALVRTTGGSEHEPARDTEHGYGTVDVRALLAVDPTAYPDENPFISDDPDAYPAAEDLRLTAEAAPEASATGGADDQTAAAPQTPDDADIDSDGSLLPVVLGALGAVVVVALVTIAIVLARRRRASATTSHQPQLDQPYGGHHG